MKKSIIVLVISVLLLIIGSCKKVNKPEPIVAVGINVAYKDNLGNNLLDSATPNHYSIANMHVFYLENGVKEEYYNGKMDNPKGLKIFQDSTGEYVLGIGLNSFRAENDTTLLQLSNTDIDTIVGTIDKSNGDIILKKVWYNGILKWEYGTYPSITIVKK
ncbi:MAG: hypothetical protein IH595_00355 [Bacteroidales bacterium]|nr:hypothetical protein [Bacteroidales bacterium]